MEHVCIACGNSGYEEHIDLTLPPPPCRICHPEEAQRHLTLVRDTRQVAAVRRRDAYQLLNESTPPPVSLAP